MTCVRCGDSKELHKDGIGENTGNPACGSFLERWPEGLHGAEQKQPARSAVPAEAPASAATEDDPPSSGAAGADPSAEPTKTKPKAIKW